MTMIVAFPLFSSIVTTSSPPHSFPSSLPLLRGDASRLSSHWLERLALAPRRFWHPRVGLMVSSSRWSRTGYCWQEPNKVYHVCISFLLAQVGRSVGVFFVFKCFRLGISSFLSLSSGNMVRFIWFIENGGNMDRARGFSCVYAWLALALKLNWIMLFVVYLFFLPMLACGAQSLTYHQSFWFNASFWAFSTYSSV